MVLPSIAVITQVVKLAFRPTSANFRPTPMPVYTQIRDFPAKIHSDFT